jgi:hypothetical protein
MQTINKNITWRIAAPVPVQKELEPANSLLVQAVDLKGRLEPEGYKELKRK